MYTRITSYLLGALFVFFSVFLLGCAPKKEAKIEVLKIGLAAPLTGDIAAMGIGMKNAAELAINEANRSGKLKGIQLKLFALDDRADPKEAVNVANRLVSEPGVVGVVGHLNSGCSIPASKIYWKAGLVMISPASTNPKLTQQGFPNVFRVCTTDDVQGSFAANFVLKKFKAKRVSIIHDKTAYGQGLAEEFQKEFKKLGGRVLSFDGIEVGDKDFKALLIKIKNLSPDLIYFGGMYSEGGLIVRQARELGIKALFMGGDGIFTNEFIRIGGNATEGVIATMVGVPPEELKEAGEFIKKYKSHYPGVDIQPYDAYTYDATGIIIEAIKHTKGDKKAMIDYISNIKYRGVIGETSFDRRGDTLNRAISAFVVKGKKFVVLD